MSLRLVVEGVVDAAADGRVAARPSAAIVNEGIGRLKASKKVGVPNVSVRAMPRIYGYVNSILIERVVMRTPSPKQPTQ